MKTLKIFFSALFVAAVMSSCEDPMDEFQPTKYADSGGPIAVQSDQSGNQKNTDAIRSNDALDVKDYGGPIN